MKPTRLQYAGHLLEIAVVVLVFGVFILGAMALDAITAGYRRLRPQAPPTLRA